MSSFVKVTYGEVGNRRGYVQTLNDDVMFFPKVFVLFFEPSQNEPRCAPSGRCIGVVAGDLDAGVYGGLSAAGVERCKAELRVRIRSV